MRMRQEFLAQGLGQITHVLKICSPPLVDPAEQLRGTKALFPQTLAKNGQTFQVEFEQVGRHGFRAQGRVRCATRSACVHVHAGKEEGNFSGSSFRRIRAVYSIGIDAVSEVSTDGARGGFLGIRRAH